MKTQIITTILLMSMFGVVSAIYAGDCDTIEFSNIYPVNWSVEGNSSDMTGFSYDKNGTTIEYCFHMLYKPDNFTITFYNYQEVDISSGGSHCKPAKDYNWNCSLWSVCVNGEQTRTCNKYNNCHNDWGRPKTNQTCFEILTTVDNVIDELVDTPVDESNTIWRVIWENILLIIFILIILIVGYFKFVEKPPVVDEIPNVIK